MWARLAIVLAFLLAGCAGPVAEPQQKGSGKAESAPPTGVPDATERIAARQEVVIGFHYADKEPTDPARASTSNNMQLALWTHNALVRYPLGTIDVLKIEPDLAERWDTSPDGKVWTFYLRKGVMFQKGFGELTAEDVKYSIERLRDPQVKAVNDVPNIANIQVVDRYTVRFYLEEPDAWFLARLLSPAGAIVSKKAVEQLGLEQYDRLSIGTGPFQYDEYVPRQSLTLVRNENYFRGRPQIERVVIRFMGTDENVRALALQNGTIHAATGMDNDELRDKLLSQGIKAAGRWGSRLALYFNITVKPLDDLRVRQAIAYALDRAQFRGFRGYEPLCAQLLPTQAYFLSCEQIPEELRYEYNPEKARQLLREAGLSGGFSMRVFTEPGGAGPQMLMVQDQLKKVGINLDLQTVDRNQFVARVREGANPIVIWRGSEATPDQALRDYFHSSAIVGRPGGRNNWSHYGEVGGSIDELLDRASATLDSEARRAIYIDAVMRLLKDLPGYPLAYLGKVGLNNLYRPCLDLGYAPDNAPVSGLLLNERTRLLEGC